MELLDISDDLVILRNGKRVPEDISPSSDQLKAVVAAMLCETPESMIERARRTGEQVHPEDAIPPIRVGPLRIVDLKGPDGLVRAPLSALPASPARASRNCSRCFSAP